MPVIVTRAQWGADYRTGFDRVPLKAKDEHFVHYHGGIPRYDRGVAMAREVEAIHHGNGWSGVGYSFMVGQDGVAYEGRGFDGVCVACPNHNTRGIHVYVAVGGDQEATPEALATVRALYDEACRRTGRALPKMGHRDGYATACPGDRLYAWVQAGMPAPATTVPEEDPLMALTIKLTDSQRDAIYGNHTDSPDTWDAEKALGYIAGQAALSRRYSVRAAEDAAVSRALAEESARKGSALTDEEVERIAAATSKRTADELSDDFEVTGDVKLAPKAKPATEVQP